MIAPGTAVASEGEQSQGFPGAVETRGLCQSCGPHPKDSGIPNCSPVPLRLVTEVCCPLWWSCHSLWRPSWHCLPTCVCSLLLYVGALAAPAPAVSPVDTGAFF